MSRREGHSSSSSTPVAFDAIAELETCEGLSVGEDPSYPRSSVPCSMHAVVKCTGRGSRHRKRWSKNKKRRTPSDQCGTFDVQLDNSALAAQSLSGAS